MRRDQWVARLTEHVFYHRHKRAYNVLTINNDLDYHFRSNTIIKDQVIAYENPSHSPIRLLLLFICLSLSSIALAPSNDSVQVHISEQGHKFTIVSTILA